MAPRGGPTPLVHTIQSVHDFRHRAIWQRLRCFRVLVYNSNVSSSKFWSWPESQDQIRGPGVPRPPHAAHLAGAGAPLPYLTMSVWIWRWCWYSPFKKLTVQKTTAPPPPFKRLRGTHLNQYRIFLSIRITRCLFTGCYRGTSIIRNSTSLGPYSRTMHWALRWS